ncbi:unnamed protein product [Dibothriocephalus latus]|uniref:Uncharacterized protein n=1 Tax=Dibothriocephalus latus TaxID=60516 RepID=A0A3P7PAX5_DIBLA|nr:unnamed protein product [Dibothriocephalus latus]
MRLRQFQKPNATVEAQWSQLQNDIHSTTLGFLGRAHCQHQNWFDDKDGPICIPPSDKDRLHEVYINRGNYANKITLFDRTQALAEKRIFAAFLFYRIKKTLSPLYGARPPL